MAELERKCCSRKAQEGCCEPEEKGECCGEDERCSCGTDLREHANDNQAA
jgi:hypothetical protein